MAVYVIPRRNVYGNGGVLGNLGNGLMNYVFGGMMARDAQARQARRSRGLWADVSQTMKEQPGLPQPEAPRPQYSEDVQNIANSATRGMPTATDNQGWKGLWDSTVGLGKEYKPGREELLSVFGRHGVTPQEAELAMNFYKNQFETADKLGYQDEVASRVNNLDYDVRSNPARAMQSGLTAQAYGLNPQGLYAYAYPNLSIGTMDNGDRNTVYTYDGATGTFGTQDFAKDVDPSKKYEADSRVRTAQINQSPKYSVVYGPNGEIMTVNDRDGSVLETGKMSYPRYGSGGSGGAPAGPKPLTPEQRMKISQEALRYAGQGGTPEEVWNRLASVAGNNPEMLSLMANSVFGTAQLPPATDGLDPQANPYYNRVPAAAAEFFRTGSIRNAGTGTAQAPQPPQAQAPVSLPDVVAEAKRLFPKETAGKTDEEIQRMIEESGR